MTGLDEIAVRLAVMTVIAHALIGRQKSTTAADTMAHEIAATARVIADALMREAAP